MTYSVGIIGTGAAPGGTEDSGMAMGYRHAEAYDALGDCELVAGADAIGKHADRFAEHFSLDPEHAYENHREMLAGAGIDIVSVATPVPTHADIVLDCLRGGDLEAIHCEKPMADTWGECRLMAREAWRRDVQLTFDHQLRFAEPVRRAVDLIEGGTIGEVERVEMARDDIYEAGTHQVDLCSYFAGDVPAEWVIGGVDYREEHVRNGVHITDQALGLWEYENGVHGLASTGVGADAVGPLNRVCGTDGVIEFDWGGSRVRRAGGDWESIDGEIGDPLPAGIEHVIDCLGTGEEPLLSARNALNGTEVIYSVWESARRRGRVDLPLTTEDNPIRAMIDSGDLLQ